MLLYSPFKMFSKLPSSPGVLEVCKCWIHECPSYQRLSAVFFTWTSYLSQWKWKRSEMLWGILNCRKWYLKLMGLRNQKRSVFIVHSPMKITKFEMCLYSYLLLAAQIALDIPIIVHLIQNKTLRTNVGVEFFPSSHGNSIPHLYFSSFVMTTIYIWIVD